MTQGQQVLVTGACGEIGQALVQELSKRGGYRIVTSDYMPLPDSIKKLSAEHVQGDLLQLTAETNLTLDALPAGILGFASLRLKLIEAAHVEHDFSRRAKPPD